MCNSCGKYASTSATVTSAKPMVVSEIMGVVVVERVANQKGHEQICVRGEK